jgi:hypothetical protein
MNSGDEAGVHRVLEEIEQRPPEAVRIVDDHRLGVQLEPTPGEQINHLFEGADGRAPIRLR